MKAFPVRDLKVEHSFDKLVFLDQRYVVLDPEVPVSQSLMRNLIMWEFRELFTDGSIVGTDRSETAPESLAGEIAAAHDAQAKDEGAPESQEPSLAVSLTEDREIIAKVEDYYQRFTAYVDQLFTRYVTRNELGISEISDRIKELADFVQENRRYVLRIQDPGAANRNYLVSHSVKSTILSLVLGSYLKMQPHKLIELGVSALLHEIGMVRLPPQLYMNDRPLSPQDRKNIFTHPVIGYNVLRGFSFPLPICLAALEHHERNNAQGYPRKLPPEKISPYAKIIAVACSYEAVTSSRPYKEAKDHYSAMVDILKNTGKGYEDNVIKALVYSLSLFPIGSSVLLSDGRPALVVDVGESDPRFPIVRILGPGAGEGKEAVVRTGPRGPSVQRIMTKREMESLFPA